MHLHHIVLLSEGGTHDPEWLIPLCGRRSRAVHEGALIVRGRFSQGCVFEQGAWWFSAIPAMPDAHLQMLMEAFGDIVAERAAFRETFGVV